MYRLTTYSDSVLEVKGAPTNLIYKVAKLGIVDHFEMTLDLDYTQFVQMPTNAPTQDPSESPSNHPTLKPSESPTPKPSESPSNHPTPKPIHPPTQSPTIPPTQCPTDPSFNTFAFYEIAAKLEITASSHVNITSNTVQQHIIESIASALNYGREYIRLDSADFMTTISRRRLQMTTESLLLGFTVFTPSETERITYSTKLEETATYHFILASLTNKIPNILSIFIANTANNCHDGTKQVTIAGQHQCQSICALNQYYDPSSNSCKDQVEFVITTSIKKSILSRMIYFGVGVAGWIVTMFIVYAGYRFYVNETMESAVKYTSKKSKKSIKASIYSVGSSEDEHSEFSETEFDSIKRKFTSSINNIIPSKKKKAKKKSSNKEKKNSKKDKKPLLNDDSIESTEYESTENEYTTESYTDSETESGAQSSTESD